MNKKIIIGLIILGLVVLFGIFWYNNSRPAVTESHEANNFSLTINGPIIGVTPSFYDFGEVVYGQVAEHNFNISNLGDEPLEIFKLSTSCGCTKASLSEEDKIIAPGQSAEMLVTFDPAVHEDDSDLGEVTRVIYLKTNDLQNPEQEVEITANVIKDKERLTADQKSDDLEQNTVTIKVMASQWEFSPNPIRVKEGDLVRLEITSLDVAHGFNLSDFNINESINPGEKVVVEFLADKKGSFNFYCSIFCGFGHTDMAGQLIIE